MPTYFRGCQNITQSELGRYTFSLQNLSQYFLERNWPAQQHAFKQNGCHPPSSISYKNQPRDQF